MSKRVDLFDSIYSNFTQQVTTAVRKETFGEDIGQNSWLMVEEYDRFISWLKLKPQAHVIEVASGSGGPALYLARRAGCRVTGIDANENGITTSTKAAAESGQSNEVAFKLIDANAPLPFAEDTFDGLMCIDSMNHFADRLTVFREWHRVLKPGARGVFTDPCLITGPVTNDERMLRSSVGLFLFVPQGFNEILINKAGLHLIEQHDVSENAVTVADRWHQARERHRENLIKIEGEDRFAGLQEFFVTVHRVTREKRLSRIVYLVEKPEN
jgi:SAM-dependent methyltransferase